MTMSEWWAVYDAKVGEPKIAGIPESEIDELYEGMKRGGFRRT